MATLDQFAVNIRKRGQAVPRGVDLIVKKVSGAALAAVVTATPVDTGRARGGWQVGLGLAPSGRTSEDRAGASTIAKGTSTISRRGTEQTVFISNNVEYIGFLNDGSSAQAPADYVGIAARRAAAIIRGSKVFK